MIRLTQLTVTNFVLFDTLHLKPSVDQDRPLTVVRAENGSGKTTLLRAILWGLYGDRALPASDDGPFRIQPVEWTPDDGPIKTTVEFEFEFTDPQAEDDWTRTRVHGSLTRSSTTEPVRERSVTAPAFRRRSDEISLMRSDPVSGGWDAWDALPEHAVRNLLPFGLRRFLVVDADEATDFVGGVEAKPIRRQEFVQMTTNAINALLGLDAFRIAARDLARLENTFRREASRAAGAAWLTDRQDELDRLKQEAESLDGELSARTEERVDLGNELVATDLALARLLERGGDPEQLLRQKRTLDREHENTARRRGKNLDAISAALADRGLYGTLAEPSFRSVVATLQPLHDEGQIPRTHLPFVRRLLRDRRCVCGASLDEDTAAHARVQREVEDSEASDRADHLGHVLEFARGVRDSLAGRPWRADAEELMLEKMELDALVQDIRVRREDLDKRMSSRTEDGIRTTRMAKDTILEKISQCERAIATVELRRSGVKPRVTSMEREIDAAHKQARAARDARACQELCRVLRQILDGAYAHIRTEQVAELTDTMRHLFREMALNTEDDDGESRDEGKATLAMIADVGIQPASGKAEDFEIYAKDSRGRLMPPAEINGASRRILALSFILATCDVSGLEAFLVADSLLNFMSGHVRTNALRATASHSPQPILLLTPADLASKPERELVQQFAGRTYTLTGQWQHGQSRGDVVNLTNRRRVALLCSCGPESHCSICERHV